MSELPFPDPPLADDLIHLRPWCDADVATAQRATQDPLVTRFTNVPALQSEAQMRRYISEREAARRAGKVLSLVVADARSDAFLGVILLLRLAWAERRGEVGYWLAPSARGRGVVTRAVRMFAPWALHDLGLARLALHTDHDNAASQAVALRCGFTREGVLRSFEERRGERSDVVVFSLLPGELA